MFDGHHLVGQFHVPPALDTLAVILFAITGALSAAKREYDWIGTMAIALVTGCGGGLIRDVLLNVRPVLLEHDVYLVAVFLAVFLVTYFCRTLARFRTIFFVADALGLSMYAVLGTQKALNNGLGIVAAILVGTVSAVGGGLIRDILTQQEASLLKPGQWYAVIAFGASASFCLLTLLTPIPGAAAGVLIVICAFTARVLAHRFNLQTRPLKPIGFESSGW